MGNRYHGKIIIVDTTNTQIGGPDADGGVKGELHIRAIKWVMTGAADIANADKVNIKLGKSTGDIIIACDAQLAALTSGSVMYSVEFGGEPWIVSGLYIEDLDGGELQFFLA